MGDIEDAITSETPEYEPSSRLHGGSEDMGECAKAREIRAMPVIHNRDGVV